MTQHLLKSFPGVIDAILEADGQVPGQQRHTAKRIFERLRDEHGFEGPVHHSQGLRPGAPAADAGNVVPLSQAPSHAQYDFGEALAGIAGVEQKAHYFVMDLPHSDRRFVKAYPAETIEAFLDGHVFAFAFLGGAPQSILYDNTKLAARDRGIPGPKTLSVPSARKGISTPLRESEAISQHM